MKKFILLLGVLALGFTSIGSNMKCTYIYNTKKPRKPI